MRVRFEGLELDEDRRELRRGGEPLAVEPRVFDLIAYLVRHRDRSVSKDELLDQIWPDREVQEGTLSVCVYRARRLVEETGARVIVNQARQGYRFVAPVELLREGAGGQDLLIGRSRALAELHRAVAEMLPSRLRTVEIVGEAGIGKTALLEELGTYGLRHRLEAWRIVAPQVGAEPFDLWTQLMSAYVARYDGRSVRRTMGEHVESMARIVPALRRQGSSCGIEDSADARPKLVKAIVRSVQAATAARPGLLLFDDVDRADADSLDALRCVIHSGGEMPLLVCIAYDRETPALATLLSEMRGHASHRRLVLDGLDQPAVSTMLEHLAGQALPPAAVAAAMQASGGNPALIEKWWQSSGAGQ